MKILLLLFVVTIIHSCCSSCRNYKILSRSLNRRDVRRILRDHNNCRAKVASGSAGQPSGYIPKLTWSYRLANKARLITDKCQFGHSTGNNYGDTCIGENIYYKSDSEPPKEKAEGAVLSWFNEKQHFTYPNKNDGNFIGHYTQLVWANTTKVGCGYMKYTDNSDMYNEILVCNYAPCGNFPGENPYERD